MAKERLSHEFVRHYRHLITLTGDNPSNLAGALDRHPELAIALKRLGEIIGVFDRYGKSARSRAFPVHPQFAKARGDFDERWACAFDEYRDRVYVRALAQMADRFLPGYRLLLDRTGNDVSAVERARGMYTELDHAMDELLKIYGSLHDRRRGLSRLIGQSPSEFREAVADVKQRWADILQKVCADLFCDAILDESQHAAEALDHKWLDDLLESLPPPPEEPENRSRFDPYRDSIADIMERLEIDCRDEAENWDEGEGREFYELKADGLNWLQDTVGLDFSELQKRWKEVSDFVFVPDHVAEKYERHVPRGLFGYLDQIRLAYITGADLPALALCRSTTELLIRRHYASDVPDAFDSRSRSLSSLMDKVRARLRDRSRLFKYVDIANDVLHSRMLDDNVYDLPARYRALVRDWVRLLKDMIDDIPETMVGVSEVPPSPISRLTHMIEAIEHIRGEMGGVSLEAFEADWRKRWLVERGVEVISEASRHLSEELKARHPHIPWPDVAGIGNRLRGYEGVEPKIVWRVARDHLGRLERACRTELAAAGG